jgi:hypothetical protein
MMVDNNSPIGKQSEQSQSADAPALPALDFAAIAKAIGGAVQVESTSLTHSLKGDWFQTLTS